MLEGIGDTWDDLTMKLSACLKVALTESLRTCLGR